VAPALPAGQKLLASLLGSLEGWGAGGEVTSLSRLNRDTDPTTAGMEVRVREVGHAVGPHASRELEGLGLGQRDLGGAGAVAEA
jgi:hypothetical protein